MKGDHAGGTAYRIEKRGDVGEPNERLGPAGHGTKVHSLEQASDSISATDAPYSRHAGVLQGMVEIKQALVIGTRQVAVAVGGVLA